MMWTHTKRVIQAGFFNFWRNGTVTLSSILVMCIALFFIGAVVFVGALLTSALEQVREKVDVRVYFVTDAPEADVLAIQKMLEALPEVAQVEYISEDKALADFKAKHATEQSILEALAELDDNPLGATLNIRTKELSQYQSITTLLKDKNFLNTTKSSSIESIDADTNSAKKLAIERLTAIIATTQQVGFVVTIILVMMAILIVFNTIRLVIYMSRDEISVMKLVGASNAYVRGPFLITGAMYGIISGLIVLGLFAPITYGLIQFSTAFGIINLFGYYISNFGQLFLLIVGSGAVIGGLSSYLAVKRYLKV